MLKLISPKTLHLLLTIVIFSLLSLTPLSQQQQQDPPSNSVSLLPSDAVSLLVFKSKADLNNHLLYTLNERFDYCQWQGVKCAQGRVVRFVLQGTGLRGSFPPDSLSRLDQLRVLSLQNNSLSGPVPDLSGLFNLKSVFLGHNSFSGSFPVSLLGLHRLRVLDLSFNNFSGSLPVLLPSLDRLDTLRLEFNQFNGSLPALNQTLLNTFNVSGNNLTGLVPVTPTLSRFGSSSFSNNPGLCGEIINKACSSRAPFFGSSNATTTTGPAPLSQSAQSQGGGGGSASVIVSPPSQKKHKKTGLALGLTIGVLLLIATLLILITLVKTHFIKSKTDPKDQPSTPPQEATHQDQNLNRPHEVSGSKPVQDSNFNAETEIPRQKRSGFLLFCAGESSSYTLEQLMRASAELLGRGSIGTTYKAVLDNQLIVSVKRLDGIKTSVTSEQVFEKHMYAVGGLRHPNLVPVRAYFQAKGERLVIYDYQPNGSLYNLIHGSRSARAKPLHWTSCLKIAEDVAQGLGYLHRESRLIHGNLKSTNVLLGSDFEACLTDYCLAILAEDSANEDPDSAAYKAPEARKSIRQATPKSDIYSFGVLLLELLTGKYPSQQPFLVPIEMLEWVRAMREDDGTEDKRLGMLVEVATVCRLTSPEQRPPMWQVLKMIQEIKESATTEDNVSVRFA